MNVHVAAGALHTYRANEHDTVLSEVATVQCILMPRAFLIAGFNEEGQVVRARYNSYAASDPAWEYHFFEKEFMNETLLGVPQQVKAIFIGSEDSMLIPASLYEEGTARGWMEKLLSICPTDVLHSHKLEQPDAEYVFALPAPMDKLIHRYFGHTPILPVGAYQMHNAPKGNYMMQCLIGQDRVIASL